MSERAFTSDDEQVNQGTRQPPLSKSGRKAILSVADEAVSIGEVRRLAIHPGGDAPDVFLSAYLQQTATPAVKELALWDVLSGAVGLAGVECSRQGLEDIGVSLDGLTAARRATSFLENALARC